jgi:hypothetical protein
MSAATALGDVGCIPAVTCEYVSHVIPMVACHDDFEVLGTPRADCQPGQSGDEAVENATHSDEDRRLFPLANSHDRYSAPTPLNDGRRRA